MPSNLTIRRATVGERSGLEAMQWRASLMWEEDRDALLAHPDAIELPDAHLRNGGTLVAELDGRTVGFAVLLPRLDGDAELDGLFVEPALWKHGIGTRLVEAAAELAAAHGASVLHVVANTRAAGFYRACGFAPLGEAQTRFGVGLAMWKTLAPRP